MMKVKPPTHEEWQAVVTEIFANDAAAVEQEEFYNSMLNDLGGMESPLNGMLRGLPPIAVLLVGFREGMLIQARRNEIDFLEKELMK